MTSYLSNTNIFLHPFPFTMQFVLSLPLTASKDHLPPAPPHMLSENKSKPSFSASVSPSIKSMS